MQIDNKKIIIIISAVLATILTLSISYYLINLANQQNAVNQQDQTDAVNYQDPISQCQGKRDEVTNLSYSWIQKWGTAPSDPGGQIRAEGRSISSEKTTLLNECSDFLDDHSKLTLTQIAAVITAQIDQNVDYGPPCDPQCKPGPPIT